jgi:hypothetical protein
VFEKERDRYGIEPEEAGRQAADTMGALSATRLPAAVPSDITTSNDILYGNPDSLYGTLTVSMGTLTVSM